MKKALIVGLPNVGKSTIFRRMAGRKIKIHAYPGTAVEAARGRIRSEGQEIEIIDVPGIYNLTACSEHETVCRKILTEEQPDIIIQVADEKNMQRSLVLTAFLAEFEIPLLLILNMADEAAQRGIKVKRHKLEELLGTAVVETVASEGAGVASLNAALARVRVPSLTCHLPEIITEAVTNIKTHINDGIRSKRAVALLCLSDEETTASWAQDISGIRDKSETLRSIRETKMLFPRPVDIIIARSKDAWAEALYPEIVYYTPVTSTPLMDKIGDMARHPVAGFFVLFSLLSALYFIVGKFAAGYLVDILVRDFFGGTVAPYVGAVTAVIPSEFVREAIMGDYGLYTMGLVPAVGLVLPIIVVFFFTFGLIEDSGYFSRLSILLDRLFRKIGLNGKAVLPIVLGFSCVTMATISTRVLDSKRERFIAIFLLSLGIPCSAKLSVILVILAQVSFFAFLTVFGVIFALMIISGFVLSRLMREEGSRFIMDIPPVRIPSITNAAKKTSYRSMMFLREALPLFFLGAFGLFLAERMGLLLLLEKTASPVVKGFLGLPPEFAESLIMGFIRGEAGIAVLKKMLDKGIMDHLQLVVATIVTILFIPCVTNFLLIIKEQGSKKALAIIVSVTAFAILTGGAVNYLLRSTNAVF